VRLEAPASITLYGKGDKIHTVPLMRQTTDLLKEYYRENRINPAIQADMPLFWGAHRNKLSRSGIRYIVERYVDIAQAGTLDMPQKISPRGQTVPRRLRPYEFFLFFNCREYRFFSQDDS